ncbi:hypothetical protein [Clostridium sp. UBA2485]|uniref:hypothetical protein n=1 Tax=Clostridium sp. UBA2485 TaxID=1946352 RepID=UPI0025C1CBBD|nr:hypothetical protein [Clostridium sp. UBA2485]
MEDNIRMIIDTMEKLGHKEELLKKLKEMHREEQNKVNERQYKVDQLKDVIESMEESNAKEILKRTGAIIRDSIITNEMADKLTKALGDKEDDRAYIYLLLKKRIKELDKEQPTDDIQRDIIEKEKERAKRIKYYLDIDKVKDNADVERIKILNQYRPTREQLKEAVKIMTINCLEHI